jgi:hypothetical protein
MRNMRGSTCRTHLVQLAMAVDKVSVSTKICGI